MTNARGILICAAAAAAVLYTASPAVADPTPCGRQAYYEMAYGKEMPTHAENVASGEASANAPAPPNG